MNPNPFWIRAGALSAFLAVALGAFGAHGLKETLTSHQSLETWQTAALYHLVHALAMLLPWSMRGRRLQPASFFLAGIALFSGSLYLLSLTGLKWLGMVTPLGGLCFLAGWLLLAIRAAAADPGPAGVRNSENG